MIVRIASSRGCPEVSSSPDCSRPECAHHVVTSSRGHNDLAAQAELSCNVGQQFPNNLGSGRRHCYGLFEDRSDEL